MLALNSLTKEMVKITQEQELPSHIPKQRSISGNSKKGEVEIVMGVVYTCTLPIRLSPERAYVRQRGKARSDHCGLRDVWRVERAEIQCRACSSRLDRRCTCRRVSHEGRDPAGWWDDMIGPGKAFDTRQILCHLFKHPRRLQGNDRTSFRQSSYRQEIRPCIFRSSRIADMVAGAEMPV